MSLKTVEITQDFVDMAKLKKLNKEAFPDEEREEITNFLEYVKQGACNFLAFYDKNIFIGFTLLALNQNTAYICFLAVDSKMRSKGYGSDILNILKEKYLNRQLVLSIERTDEDCENIAQRKARKQFYFHNNFKEAGVNLSYNGLNLEVLFCGEQFDTNSYASLFKMVKNTAMNSDLSEN